MATPTDRTFSYVPSDSVAVQYSFAVAFLMITRAAPGRWLVGLGLVLGSGWWALVGIQRHQSTWWLGFVIAVVASIVVLVVFALAVLRNELRTPTYPTGKVVESEVTLDMITLTCARGVQRIVRNDIDRSGRAFGFTLLAATDHRVFLIAPSQLLPADVVAGDELAV